MSEINLFTRKKFLQFWFRYSANNFKQILNRKVPFYNYCTFNILKESGHLLNQDTLSNILIHGKNIQEEIFLSEIIDLNIEFLKINISKLMKIFIAIF